MTSGSPAKSSNTVISLLYPSPTMQRKYLIACGGLPVVWGSWSKPAVWNPYYKPEYASIQVWGWKDGIAQVVGYEGCPQEAESCHKHGSECQLPIASKPATYLWACSKGESADALCRYMSRTFEEANTPNRVKKYYYIIKCGLTVTGRAAD